MQIDLPILFIGDRSHSEFAPVAAWLASRSAKMEQNIDGAMACIQSGFTPAIVVVAQPWPGHVSPKEIESLRHLAPLARIVSLLGTWLEGESRTGKPWPATWRTYWHNWLPRFANQIEHFQAGEQVELSLPATAGDEERVLQVCAQPVLPAPPVFSARTISIISTSRESAESLGDVCRRQNWKSICLRFPIDEVPANTDLILFDARKLSAAEIANILSLKSQTGDVPIVVLTGFPRLDDCSQLRGNGIAAVVSKPYLWTELAWQIERAIFKSPRDAA